MRSKLLRSNLYYLPVGDTVGYNVGEKVGENVGSAVEDNKIDVCEIDS